MIGGVSFGINYSRMDRVKFFNGCLPHISLGPFLNTLSHLSNGESVKEAKVITKKKFLPKLFSDLKEPIFFAFYKWTYHGGYC